MRGPLIVAAGPFVDGPQEASASVISVKDGPEAREGVRALKSRGVDFIKVQAGLSAEAWRAVAEERRALGIPFAGHVPEAVSAAEVPGSGQRSIEHVSPALPGDAAILLACSMREAELRQELREIAAIQPQDAAAAAVLRIRRRAHQATLLDTYDPATASSHVSRGTASPPCRR